MHILFYDFTASLTSLRYTFFYPTFGAYRDFLQWSHITTTWALFLNIFSEGQIFGMHITASCTLLYANVLLMLMRFLFLGHYIWLLRLFSSSKYIFYAYKTFILIQVLNLLIRLRFNRYSWIHIDIYNNHLMVLCFTQ